MIDSTVQKYASLHQSDRFMKLLKLDKLQLPQVPPARGGRSRVQTATPPMVPTVIAPVCRVNSVCPGLTTCVLNKLRLFDELGLFYHDVSRASFAPFRSAGIPWDLH